MDDAVYFIAGFEITSSAKRLWSLRATNLPAADLAAEMFNQRGLHRVSIRKL